MRRKGLRKLTMCVLEIIFASVSVPGLVTFSKKVKIAVSYGLCTGYVFIMFAVEIKLSLKF
jgi:hypothetical protein